MGVRVGGEARTKDCAAKPAATNGDSRTPLTIANRARCEGQHRRPAAVSAQRSAQRTHARTRAWTILQHDGPNHLEMWLNVARTRRTHTRMHAAAAA